jgi:hypothetical protein
VRTLYLLQVMGIRSPVFDLPPLASTLSYTLHCTMADQTAVPMVMNRKADMTNPTVAQASARAGLGAGEGDDSRGEVVRLGGEGGVEGVRVGRHLGGLPRVLGLEGRQLEATDGARVVLDGGGAVVRAVLAHGAGFKSDIFTDRVLSRGFLAFRSINDYSVQPPPDEPSFQSTTRRESYSRQRLTAPSTRPYTLPIAAGDAY